MRRIIAVAAIWTVPAALFFPGCDAADEAAGGAGDGGDPGADTGSEAASDAEQDTRAGSEATDSGGDADSDSDADTEPDGACPFDCTSRWMCTGVVLDSFACDGSRQVCCDPTGDDTGGDGDADADSDADADDPLAASCHESAQDWPDAWAQFEAAVLTEVNARRTAGDVCTDARGNTTSYGPVAPLTMDPILQCAARVHSVWMADNGTLSHESPGGPIGDTVNERLATAGYEGMGWAENIAMGQRTPAEAVAAWMGSTAGHCTAIMSDDYTLIGIGYAFVEGGGWGGGHYWTQDFGAAPRQRPR